MLAFIFALMFTPGPRIPTNAPIHAPKTLPVATAPYLPLRAR